MGHTITSMALFCDFENIALGVRDAQFAKFDIDRVLDRLLLKGSIVLKKAYCDWERYKEFKAPMHEASFEGIAAVEAERIRGGRGGGRSGRRSGRRRAGIGPAARTWS